MKYVAGFLFKPWHTDVWLIQKERPEWQKGKLNGIGGKILEGEEPLAAMIREFKEEAGLNITGWRPFCELYFGQVDVVYFFTYIQTRIDFDMPDPVAQTDEKIFLVPTIQATTDCAFAPCVGHLGWLIPMALNKDNLMAKVWESK